MKVAAVQFHPRGASKKVALSRLAELCREAPDGTELLVLPELAATPYLMSSADGHSKARSLSETSTGETYTALSEVARLQKTWLVAGFIERESNKLFNSALIINPEGELAGTYRKTLLYWADWGWAWPGDTGYQSFKTKSGTFTVGICMDLNDPHFNTWVYRTKPTAVAFPTNWVESDLDTHSYWRRKMLWSKAALVAGNTWGSENSVTFSGSSAIICNDKVLTALGPRGHGIVSADLPDLDNS